MKLEKKWMSLMKKQNLNLSSFILIFFLILSSCSSIPKNTADSCSIFSERYLWYKYAKKTEKKWGTPIYIQLAIIKMESDFDWLAKPNRQKIFKVIPYKRPSSSFGYSQAVKGTWAQYKKETNNKLATRTRFKDSVDFIGWYTDKTEKLLKKNKKISFRKIIVDNNVSKVSIIGVGMITTPGVTYRMFNALAKKNINIIVISTSEIKISVLVNRKNINKAVSALHKEFNLEN